MMNHPQPTRRGGNSVLLLHLSVMLFGFSAVLGQFVDAPAAVIAGGRVVWSSAALLVFSLVKKSSLKLGSKRTAPQRRPPVWCWLCTGPPFSSPSRVPRWPSAPSPFPPSRCSSPFWNPLVFHEPLRPRSVVTALVLPAGVGITIPNFTLANHTTVGILWGLVSALAYAVLSLANRYLSGRYEARTICLYEQGTAAVVLLPALLFLGETPAPRELIGGAVILGVAVFSSLAPSSPARN